MNNPWLETQEATCAAHDVTPVGVMPNEKVGIARNVRDGVQPVNGVRIAPGKGTSGWYIWAGSEMSTAADFFVPIHILHLEEWCKAAMPFLLLPPGWRFLVAGEYVDVWFDPQVDLYPDVD